MSSFLPTTASYTQGARTLDRSYYTSPDVLAEEWTRIFARSWLCVGRAAEVAARGSYALKAIGVDEVIVLRDRGGALRAFHNVCRHRGTRICEAPCGTLRETMQCPYHAWTYALDGRLVGAPHMQEVEGFDRDAHGLHPVRVAEWEGFLFLGLSSDGQSFEDAFAPLAGRFERFNLGALVPVRRIEYDVRANWKLILQNYNECLHCPTIHPQLARVLPYQSGENDLVEGPFLGGFMEIVPPNESVTVTGRACGVPLGALGADDLHRAFYYSLFPNAMLSIHPDYVVAYTVWPESPTASRIVSEWLVHPDTAARDGFDPSDAVEFWDETNRQDWHICERSQAGVSSSVYAPGPYSPRESIPAAWDREYLRRMST